jgi:cyclic beta-1,2-glucan synthetase
MSTRPSIDGDSPIRGEILGPADLEAAARKLARAHTPLPGRRRGYDLLRRLEDNQQSLRASRQAILAAARRHETITPAAEWLAENFHVVEEQVRAVRDALPRGYYRRLPKLADREFAGLPRVYALAWHYLAHTDSRFDGELLRRYVAAYDSVETLTLGELWAVAISLRLLLVENLRRLATGVAERRAERTEAERLAHQLLRSPSPERAADAIAPQLGRDTRTARLLQRLRENSPESESMSALIVARLAAAGLDADDVMRAEHQRQAANQVTVANIITSMRHVSAFDWPPFVEAVSQVESALRDDPAAAYAAQDFATRDVYRHAVEELSRGTAVNELEVTRRVLALAAAAAPGRRENHVGYWLTGGGQRELEESLGYRAPLRLRINRAVRAGGLPLYLGAILALTAAAGWPLLVLTRGAPLPWRIVLAALAVPALSSLATAVVQRAVAWLVPPKRLPKLAFRAGVPTAWRTLVAVPTLLGDADDARRQVEQLEIHYLSNPEGEVHFALLADLRDAPRESMPEDAGRLAAARAAIAALNERHGPLADGGPRFFLLARRRLWNPQEGVWMGWERKRGKLQELNALLRGSRTTSFVDELGGAPVAPAGVRFVATLDADTRVPRDEIRRLAGALAHPLNRPRLDPASGRVIEGYGILQPRVVPMLPELGEGTLYQTVFAGPTGIDPYVGAVSDAYQDLFEEGSFTGKGIYDVDAFATALRGRVPENTLLSHDLFEGSLARCGLATDLTLFEDFPGHAEVDASRQHRWTRGDWQLLPWLLKPTGAKQPESRPSGLDALARWKTFDNLRRTVVAPASWLLLVGGWLAGVPAAAWTIFVGAALASPAFVPLVTHWPRRRGIAKRTLASTVAKEIALATAQGFLAIAFLATRSWRRLDAIGRVVWRMAVSRRHLLEWQTAAQAGALASLSLTAFYRSAAPALAIATASAALLGWRATSALPVALPIVGSWLAAPAIARWLSTRRPDRALEGLRAEDAEYLRLVARETYGFFERFAGPEHHWLVADNFQEDPQPTAALRTSPTNLGLALLATVTARDFGWIGTHEAFERLDAQLGAIERLERYRGHLLNWYDISTLQALPPRYVSTVDSGNLAGHLLVLASACDEFASQPWSPERARSGLSDAIALARRALESLSGRAPETYRRLSQVEADLATPIDERGAPARLVALAEKIAALAESAGAEATEVPGLAGVVAWAEAAGRAAASQLADLERTAAALDPEPSQARQHLRSSAAGSTATAVLAEEPPARTEAAPVLARRAAALRARALALAEGMEFGFLFEPERRLFAIGYHLDEGRRDPTHFDLLASEARLASFVAIAHEQAPVSHWFRMGRPVAPVGRGSALLSWSGSMFEYLMPTLVMAEPSGSLLATSGRLAVREQMRWARRRRLPWGVSESAYNARDLQMNYQYGPFGVPTLGLRHTPSDEVVIAPYATLLAAMIAPRSAVSNLRRLESLGARGPCGFYEAVDYTPSRLPEGSDHVLIRAYMAHHQGMALLAVSDALGGARMRTRFHAQPAVRATELLLQERTPRDVMVVRPVRGERPRTRVERAMPPTGRRLSTPHTAAPRLHLLSNGRYSVAITQAGGGWSRNGEIAVTRFRADPTLDDWGSFIYLRDSRSGRLWSAGYQPTRAEPESYDVVFSEAKVEIHRRDGAISSHLEVVVSPEDDAELRRLKLTNHGARPRFVEVTSYAEVVLGPPAADEAHAAFSKLFVETELLAPTALAARRRPRSAEEQPLWAAHVMAVEGAGEGAPQFETDRARFLGRGRDASNPAALDGRPLSGTLGAVLDPCFSLRRSVVVPAGATLRLVFTTVAAASREEAVRLAGKYSDTAAFPRAASLAWTHAQVEMRDLGIAADEAALLQRLATRLVFPDPALRPAAAVGARNRLGQSALWPLGISGDRPIALLRIDHEQDRDVARQMSRAHAYWMARGLAVDLVILNADPSTYLQGLQTTLEGIARHSEQGRRASGGSSHVVRADRRSSATRVLLRATAAIEIDASRGGLAEQALRLIERGSQPPPLRAPGPSHQPPASETLSFANGLGGFAPDGSAYVVTLGEGQTTPAPWVNVVANPEFGFTVSESGSGYTWSGNSRENRLTPCSNDPVGDRPGEVIYLRDEDSGEVWTVTAAPVRGAGAYVCRHGQGWTRFTRLANDIDAELTLTASTDAGVKIARLELRNASSRRRRLRITAYAEWVLGTSRSEAAPHVVTWRDASSGALFAANHWKEEFAERVAFAWLSQTQGFTADRAEFLGRHGHLALPAALATPFPLSGSTGAGLDPCAVLQTELELAPGKRGSCTFLLGQGADETDARRLVELYSREPVERVLERVGALWQGVQDLEIATPEPALDLLVNRWLLYQTLGCRIWARAGFYQSSGAFGFRDQLQDVLALTSSRPDLARQHLLRAAERQFREGDVQHWWHPPSGRGVRTRCSDDLLWLPYAVAEYVEATGDAQVLDADCGFLEQPPVPADREDDYRTPDRAPESASLFEHCARAVDRALASTGAHGLPLIGAGDWNDGMNRVGAEGRGESVWLGWFLCAVIARLSPLADRRGETRRAESWRGAGERLRAAIETSAWDGAWYRRAFWDDGAPLGTSADAECRIDSIAQSWAVISGAGDRDRASRAMSAVDEILVRRGDGIVLLFTPPFDRTPRDPGYIKGYPAGVRENGGQYTHGAVWTAIAFAMLGDGDRAAEVLNLINPVHHTRTSAGLNRYRLEPYVMPGDVYSQPPHVGRGGWSWYTGSAGWMYRAAVEWLLGLRRRGAALVIDPCIPRGWPGFEARLRFGAAGYRVAVDNPRRVSRGVTAIALDGRPQGAGAPVPLVDDGAEHLIRVTLG